MFVRDMLAAFPRIRIAVLGDAMLDRFTIGTASRLCRERPVPVVVKRDELDFPGGAGNVAANARALGARVQLVSALGSDESGRLLRALLADRDIDLEGVAEAPHGRTGQKTRVVADDQYLARVDVEPAGFDEDELQRELVARLEAAYALCDAIVVSDYGGGIVGPRVLRALAELRSRRRIPLIVDARELAPYADLDADAITPNLDEAALLAGVRVPHGGDREAVRSLAHAAAQRLRARTLALTLGAEGVLLLQDGEPVWLAGRRVQVRNTCGAGDAFVAAVSIGIAAGANAREAAAVGLEAAAVAVAKPYTATVTLSELRDRLDLLGAWTSPPVADDGAVIARLAQRRAGGERIVLTNGVFDLLHAGHLSLLQRARALGDTLVVALNSDRSAATVKGPHRPITDERQRRAALEALACVDEVIVFDAPTAEAMLERIRPDVYARGDDRDISELPEVAAAARLGIPYELLPCVGDLTTSRIIARVAARTHHWSPAPSV